LVDDALHSRGRSRRHFLYTRILRDPPLKFYKRSMRAPILNPKWGPII
jgi:hypothetical protein